MVIVRKLNKEDVKICRIGKNAKTFLASNAFTLAEVLITLSIIGIVAALTIPTLINNIQNQQWKTAYRKAYSDLCQAVLSAKNNNDFVYMDGANPGPVRTNFDAIKSYFKVIKSCENSVSEGCWIDTCTTITDCCPAGDGNSYAFVDNSGRFWNHYRSTGFAYLRFVVDTNGANPPNSYGRDKWYFPIITSTGTTHIGTPNSVGIYPDIIAPTGSGCRLGNCYYTSYLTNAQ